MKSKKVLLCAGEASGDLHGAHLVEAVRRMDPGIRFFGMGGQALRRAGMDLLYPNEALSVVGFTEVFSKLPVLFRVFLGLKRSLDLERPDLVILIDYPDFNLRLARAARRRGIPVLYYISPQVWAWRAGRVRWIARCVKKMLVLFPFEVPVYERAGVDVEWIGHPLVDIVKVTQSRAEGCKRFGLDPGRPTVALLPGSRGSEVTRLLPVLLASAQLLRHQVPALQFVLPVAPGISREALRPAQQKAPVPVTVIEGATYEAMNLSDLLITASGTATLEGALLGKPMIIVYKVSPLSYWLGRALVRVDHIGMVNLVAGRAAMPELLQKRVTAENISSEALRILRTPDLQRQMASVAAEVRERLGAPGASERAARIVCDLLAQT